MVELGRELPLPVIDLRVEASDGGRRVAGVVLTASQLRDVARIAGRHGAGLAVDALADPAAGLELGWLAIDRDLVEVWRSPAAAGDDHGRQTEYLAADGPLRLLGRAVGLWLVQGPDLTVGWAAPDGLREINTQDGRAAWQSVRRAGAGAAAAPDPSRAGSTGADVLRALLAAARAELGVPYRWGGTTHAGFDCSGLVQRVFRDATGVLLPKHTGDQRQVGQRVIEGEARAGDLLFATPRGRRFGHVLLLTARDTVLHACRTEHEVIEEPLAENARRYQHQGYRRPVVVGPD